MSDPFLQPGGEPTRPLPPYRLAPPGGGQPPLRAQTGPGVGLPFLPAPAASHSGFYGLPSQQPGLEHGTPPAAAPVSCPKPGRRRSPRAAVFTPQSPALRPWRSKARRASDSRPR